MSETQDKQDSARQRISFTAFVLSLSTAALQQLGVKIAEGEDPCTNLVLAQQTIDILDMLEKKTEGNLTEEERKLLAAVLYDLRMRYVDAASAKGCPDLSTPK